MKPLTYPARPVQGGPLDKARAKPPGTWYYEPKYNGWRALVHVPTGTMFNRQGEQLSIAKEFTMALNQLKNTVFEWLDCEALDRRHGLGCGSLIILDEPGSPLTYEARKSRLARYLVPDVGARALSMDAREVHTNALLLAPVLVTERQAADAWLSLQAVNTRLGCEFYEGLVAKRGDSLYPIQLRSPEEIFGGWIKHRWQW